MRSRILAFVLGVWLLQQQAALPSFIWLALLPLFLLLWWLTRNSRHPTIQIIGHASLLAFSLALGFFWAATLATLRLADSLPADLEGKDIEVVGVIASLPQAMERGERFIFDVEQSITPQPGIPCRISLNTYPEDWGKGTVVRYHPGERWRFTVRLKRPHGNANPYGFDFEAWALERNIRATGYVRKGEQIRLDTLVIRPAYLIEHARESIRNRMQRALQGQQFAGVLTALAIGDEQAIPREQWHIFLRTGITHLISISGLHITMLSGLAFALCYGIWRRLPALVLRLPARKAAVLAGVATALGYSLLAGFAVPAQRTVYMLAVVAAALWSGRNISSVLILCWALLVTTLLDPWAVLSAGFWLSFGAVAAMLFVGMGHIQRPHWLKEAMATQWAVTLGLMPLLLVLFQQVSLVSPLANAIAIPVVSLLVTPLTLIGAVLPWDDILLAAHTLLAWLIWLLQPLSTLPAALWQQHAPPIWTFALAMPGVLWLLLPRGFPARWLGLVLLAPMFLMRPTPPPSGEMRMSVLDVGQGLAVVVQTTNHTLLYDTGPRYSADADSGSRIVTPYLRGNGIATLDGLVISHDDTDHSGGAASILDNVPIGWLLSSLPSEHELLRHAARALPCFAGQHWQWDGIVFDILHPSAPNREQTASPSPSRYRDKDNDKSCVLKVSGPHGSLLLTGDIERKSELELISTPSPLAADVLIAAHHGSKSSSSQEFINAVAPQIAIFSAGYRNRFHHPAPEVVERFAVAGSKPYRTDADGALLLDFSPQGIRVTQWREAHRRYWQVSPAVLAETGMAR